MDEHKAVLAEFARLRKDLSKKERKKGHRKVWDHCYITGKFREAAHNSCNLKLQIEAWKTPSL
jgi:hypothetical protein